MNRQLTDQQRELLSTYHDGEATPAESRAAELLLLSSPKAEEWLAEVDRVARLQEAAARGAMARVGTLSELDGARIALLAGKRGALRRGLSSRGVIGLALVALLSGASFATFDNADNQGVASRTEQIRTAADHSAFPQERKNLLTAIGSALLSDAPESEAEELLVAADPQIAAPVRDITPQPSARGEKVESKGQVTPSTDTSTPAPSSPVELSITLHHSSADVIIGDDQWSDTLHLKKSDDQILALSSRISSLTDSLNADVARIAADTAQSSGVRAGLILMRQLEYEREVARQLEALRKMIERDDPLMHHPDGLEGAAIDDRVATGVS